MSKIGVISLGCSKNLVDTEYMLALLKNCGHSLVSKPQSAEVLIINTCGFIEPAKQESINTILEMAEYKKQGSCKMLIVTGCLSERYKEELKLELPEVDNFLGVHEYDKLPTLLGSAISPVAVPCLLPRILTTPFYSAYLRISDGCDNRCTYCAIPLIRGAMHSVPMPALLDEAKSLLDNGVSELTLIAQDTSSYGRDLYAKPMLLELLNALAKLNGLRFLRVLYTYPDTVTPKLIDCIANDEKICNYLDMPLQHIDVELLLKMNRRGSRQHVEQVLEHIRTTAPDFILRTTIMVGFPGETDAKFDALLSFLRTYQFDRLGAFAFSQEDGTSAASMPNQVPSEIKTLRLNALMAQQREISLSLNQKRVGSVVQVLFEGMRDGFAIGRSYAEAPEIDGAILFKPLREHKAGEYLNVKLSLACDYDLIGEELP